MFRLAVISCLETAKVGNPGFRTCCGLNMVKSVFYLRFIWQKGDVDFSQGLHGFGGAGFGQQSKQGVWDCCRESQKNMVTD